MPFKRRAPSWCCLTALLCITCVLLGRLLVLAGKQSAAAAWPVTPPAPPPSPQTAPTYPTRRPSSRPVYPLAHAPTHGPGPAALPPWSPDEPPALRAVPSGAPVETRPPATP